MLPPLLSYTVVQATESVRAISSQKLLSLSPMALFSLLCWLAHQPKRDKEGNITQNLVHASGGKEESVRRFYK